jgi:hypothetical protein
VACFVKQLGAKPFDTSLAIDVDVQTMRALTGNQLKLQHRKGADPAEWPEDLRVREWPEAAQ